MHIYIYTFPESTFAIAIARLPTAPRGAHDHVSLTARGVWRTAGVVLPATVVAAGALEGFPIPRHIWAMKNTWLPSGEQT